MHLQFPVYRLFVRVTLAGVVALEDASQEATHARVHFMNINENL